MLAFSVFMLLIAESMPATSEFVPLIGQWELGLWLGGVGRVWVGAGLLRLHAAHRSGVGWGGSGLGWGGIWGGIILGWDGVGWVGSGVGWGGVGRLRLGAALLRLHAAHRRVHMPATSEFVVGVR